MAAIPQFPTLADVLHGSGKRPGRSVNNIELLRLLTHTNTVPHFHAKLFSSVWVYPQKADWVIVPITSDNPRLQAESSELTREDTGFSQIREMHLTLIGDIF